MIPVRRLFGILLVFLALRSLFGELLFYAWPMSMEINQTVAKALGFSALIALCLWQSSPRPEKILRLNCTSKHASELYLGVLLGAALFGIMLGENTIEVLLIAQISPEKAYAAWNFHWDDRSSTELWELYSLVVLAVNCILVPTAEELFFRVHLVRSLMTRSGFKSAAFLSSALFTLLHYKGAFYISTFIFALVLCQLYSETQNLAACVTTHGTYNLLAFIMDNVYDFHFTKDIADLPKINSWIPEIILLFLSLTLLIKILHRLKAPTASASTYSIS